MSHEPGKRGLNSEANLDAPECSLYSPNGIRIPSIGASGPYCHFTPPAP